MWNGSTVEIEVVLLRHGATFANEEHRYLGRTEQSLSETGRKQMEECKARLDGFKPDLLFVSPMIRCKESAIIVFGNQKQIMVDEWREMDFGLYEGKNYLELQSDSYYQKWIDSNGTLPFPQGESQSGFITRCKDGMKQVEQKLIDCFEKKDAGLEASSEKLTLAAVVHGGTIMAIMNSLYNGNYFDYQVKNGDGYRFHFTYNRSNKSMKIVEDISCLFG